MSLSLLFPIASSLATTLLVVLFLFQACAGYASPLPGHVSAPASVNESCCGSPSQSGCGDLSVIEASDVCAPYCAKAGHPAPSQIAVSAFDGPVYRPALHADKIIFFAQGPTLGLAPRAISSTPLIYHLQRLLN